jgi:protein-S-isoprenylcysteine O-methyltransferase Ste14
MSPSKLVALLLGALCIAVLTLPSLRAGWKHALPRSLAFLSILGVFVLNIDTRALQPLTTPGLLSWILLLTSVALALHAYYVLRRYGGPQGSIDFTTTLVTAGVYRFIRHPLYASLVCLTWGVLLKQVSPAAIALTITATLLLYLTAKREEVFSASKFGPAYADYVARTKMFVPFLI